MTVQEWPKLAVGDEVLIIGGRRTEPAAGRIEKVGTKLYHVTKDGNTWWVGKFNIGSRDERCDFGAQTVIRTRAEHARDRRRRALWDWLNGLGVRLDHTWVPLEVEALAETVAKVRGLDLPEASDG